MAAPAYVGDDTPESMAYMRDQVRWFGGMVGNHVADIVLATATRPMASRRRSPTTSRAARGTTTTNTARPATPTPTSCPTRSSTDSASSGPPSAHLQRLGELRDLGVDQFAIYLQHDGKDHTLAEYGEHVIPPLNEAKLAKS